MNHLTINNSTKQLLTQNKKFSQLQVLVVQSPHSPTLHIKEQPPSPGSPSTDTMYAATGGTQIYLQVFIKINFFFNFKLIFKSVIKIKILVRKNLSRNEINNL